MNVVGLAKEEQDEIFKMLAIILWLGNIQFSEGDDGNSVVADADGEYKAV
jgi:myosin-1